MGKCAACNRERPGILTGQACQFCVEKDHTKTLVSQQPTVLQCFRFEDSSTYTLPGVCLQLNTKVQTHEPSPWHVSMFVFYGKIEDRHDILKHSCCSDRKWKAGGSIVCQSLADLLHMHTAAPWVPKAVPHQLFLERLDDELMFIAVDRDSTETIVLRARNFDPEIVRYYHEVISKYNNMIVMDQRFQNPRDTRFVLKSHGTWQLTVEVGSVRDLDDGVFKDRSCESWSADKIIQSAQGDPVGIIDCSDTQCRTLIGALKLCHVTVLHLGRELQDNKLDAALLCRWFPEQLQRVFILEKDDHNVTLLCHGRSMQTRVNWTTMTEELLSKILSS